MCIFSVGLWGFTPMRAARCLVMKVPKPVRVTSPPAFSVAMVISSKFSRTISTSLRARLVFLAMVSMRSALFICVDVSLRYDTREFTQYVGADLFAYNDVLGRVTSLPSYPIETSLSNRWMAVARLAAGSMSMTTQFTCAMPDSMTSNFPLSCVRNPRSGPSVCTPITPSRPPTMRAPVRVPAKGVFFRRRLRVKINHHRVGVRERGGLHQGVKCPEGAVEDFMHEYPPHEIDDGETPRSYRDDVHAASRHGGRIVCGPQDAAAVLLEYGLELFL